MKNNSRYFRFAQRIVEYFLVILLSACLCACEPPLKSPPTSLALSQPPSQQLWGRLRANYEITPETKSVATIAIEKQTRRYQHQQQFAKLSKQATPYLYHIVEQLEKRNMPGELALLPMVESAFKPQATSHQGAAGLWQFIPSTGRLYGLKQDAWYDGRRDIVASTTAALDYLAFLYETFDQDWPLALAAYNAGQGTVQRAIKRNQKAGKPTGYWDLTLPRETREFVPKLLALATIVKHPEKHDVALPAIENKPYFVRVNPKTPLHFHQAAKLADIRVSELKRLNPGYRRATTHPNGPQTLLLPVANAKKFEYNLSKQR
jgi:membrane-bound lytic murein transglycosylase D